MSVLKQIALVFFPALLFIVFFASVNNIHRASVFAANSTPTPGWLPTPTSGWFTPPTPTPAPGWLTPTVHPIPSATPNPYPSSPIPSSTLNPTSVPVPTAPLIPTSTPIPAPTSPPFLSPTPTPQGGLNCIYNYTYPCTNSDQCKVQPGSDAGCQDLECNTTPGDPNNGKCMVLGPPPPPNRDVCRSNACTAVYDPLCDGTPGNTHCQDKCQDVSSCVPGGYAGDECVCKACPSCNTGGTYTCNPDWSCIATTPSCQAGVNSCYDTGTKYSEDKAKPAFATFTNPGDQTVFTGPQKNYFAGNWDFQWTSTPNSCTGQFYWYFLKNGQWELNSFQDISTNNCVSKACKFGANWSNSGAVTDRVLLKLNVYQNDQTGCTARISNVKLRRPYQIPLQGTLYGKVYADTNKDCKKGSDEATIVNYAEIVSKDKKVDTFSDEKGKWEAIVKSTTYQLYVTPPPDYQAACPAQKANIKGGDQVKVDFLVQAYPSPTPTVAVKSPQGAVSPENPTVIPSATPASCLLKPQGDADCDDKIDDKDYALWRAEYLNIRDQKLADFNRDNQVTLEDYEIWRKTVQK